MKPTRMQYFFASDWPCRIVLTVITTVITLLLPIAVITGPTPEEYSGWLNLLIVAGFCLISLPIGFLSSLVIGWPIICILYSFRSEMNGAPFHKGDLVHILVGPHRDRLVSVSEVWRRSDHQHPYQVRVELGAKEKEEEKDLFASDEICKEQDA